MDDVAFEEAERQFQQLEARIAHQKMLATQLARHGFKGAAEEALLLLATLRKHLGDKRRTLYQKAFAD